MNIDKYTACCGGRTYYDVFEGRDSIEVLKEDLGLENVLDELIESDLQTLKGIIWRERWCCLQGFDLMDERVVDHYIVSYRNLLWDMISEVEKQIIRNY